MGKRVSLGARCVCVWGRDVGGGGGFGWGGGATFTGHHIPNEQRRPDIQLSGPQVGAEPQAPRASPGQFALAYIQYLLIEGHACNVHGSQLSLMIQEPTITLPHPSKWEE